MSDSIEQDIEKIVPYVEPTVDFEVFSLQNTVFSEKFLDYDQFDDIEIMSFNLFNEPPSFLTKSVKSNAHTVFSFLKDRGFKKFRDYNNSENYTFTFLNMDLKMFVKVFYNRTEDWDGERYTTPKQYDLYITVAYPIVDKETTEFFSLFVEFLSSLTPEETVENNSTVHIFEKEGQNLKLVPYSVKGYDLNIDKHYNDDFADANTRINQWVSNFDDDNQRLVLLHGEPGAGKTNYIKYLLSQNPSVRKIYIPPYYVEALSDPGFFTFIKKYSNSLLIIEDAEKILRSRDDGDSGVMSILLNLTDGIMASVLNFKIICTFNTDEKNIDKALKRKGRLFLKYHFSKLNKKKTAALYDEVYDADPPNEEMTLGEIFNPEDNGIKPPEPRGHMGFRP